jgi:membrane fusion protein, multidrug efflux system
MNIKNTRMKNLMIQSLTVTSVLAATVLFTACGGGAKPDTKKAELETLNKQMTELKDKIAALEKEIGATDTTKKANAKFVGLADLKAETFKTYIDVQGKVDAEENVVLNAQMPGVVTAIYVKPGQMVSAGTVLAETDNKAMLANMASLQTNLDLLTSLYEKQKALWDQKIGTEVQYLQSKTQKESLEKQIGALQAQLKMTKVVSPISGTVDAVDLKIGGFSSPGLPIGIRVVNFSKLKVKAEVAEGYISKIKTGDQVEVILPDANTSVNAKVSYAARAINALTRTFDVEAALASDVNLRPNMVAKIKVNDYTSPASAIVLPVSYVQKDESNNNFVMLAENNKVIKRMIKTGKSYSGRIEVIEGLKVGEKYITEGYESVEDGDIIKTEATK